MTDTGQAAKREDLAASLEGMIGTIAASPVRSFVAILIVALVTFMPGFRTIAPLDRDEPRYALETKLMVETGQFAADRADIQSYVDPRGINWLQFVSVGLTGDGAASPIWVYRLPSLIAAIGVALLTWWMALAFGRPRAALFAAFLITTTPLLVAEAHLAKADALMLAGIVLAQGALARLWRSKAEQPDYRHALLFWFGLAVGIAAKGPVAPIIVGLTVAVLVLVDRSSAWLARLMPLGGAIGLVVLLFGAYAAANMLTGAGPGARALPLGIASQEVYQAPPGSYAVLFYPLFGPAGVFVALAIPGLIERVRRPVFLFAIAWVVPFWLVIELWPAKLPYFILPAYPALALVGATAIDEGWLKVSGWISSYFTLNLLVWPALVAIGATALFFAGENHLPWVALPFFALAIIAGIVAFLWFYRGRSVVAAAVLSLLSATLVYTGLFGAVFSDATSLQVSGRLAAAARTHAACAKPELASTGYFEPSLVFYTGNHIQLISPEETADFLAAGGCRVAFVEGRRQSIFNQRAEDLGLELNVKDEIRGFDIGNWKQVKMRVFAVEGSRS